MATQGLMSSQIADMLQSGMSPQEIRQQMQNSQAMDFAKLTPNQQMSYNINRSVGGFADSLLGAFGVNQEDPTLAKASLLAQIRNEIDPTDEKSIIGGAQKLAKLGFLQEAQTQAAKALAMREKEATISAKTAEKLTPEERNAAAIVNRMPNILSGSPQWHAEFKKQLERLTTKAEATTTIEKLQKYRDTLPKGSQERAEVEAAIKAEGEGKGTKIVNEIPGLKGTGDIVSLRQNLNTTLKPYRDAVNAADTAISLADDVLKTGNFASASALSRQLAKAAGEQQLSKADVDAFGGDPSLVGMVSDVASRLATGTPTADTTRKLKQLATIIKKKNEALENNEIRQTQRAAELSGLYKPDQIKEVFTLRGNTQASTNVRRTKSGVEYTVGE